MMDDRGSRVIARADYGCLRTAASGHEINQDAPYFGLDRALDWPCHIGGEIDMILRQQPRLTGIAALALLAALGGCDENVALYAKGSAPAAPPAARAQDKALAAKADSVKLAYTHQLALEMPSQVLEPRFERARTACLEDPELGCILVGSSIEHGNSSWTGYPRATLTIRLPHGKVDGFEDTVLAPLPDEALGHVAIRSRSTNAEDLTQAIGDLDRRLDQLTNFRDRLTVLAKHTDAKVEDLIKVEQQLAETQSQIEALIGQHQHLNEQVATEKLTIEFQSETPLTAPSNPVAVALAHAGADLSRNAGLAITALIDALPWLLLFALVAPPLRWTWRRWWRRPARA